MAALYPRCCWRTVAAANVIVACPEGNEKPDVARAVLPSGRSRRPTDLDDVHQAFSENCGLELVHAEMLDTPHVLRPSDDIGAKARTENGRRLDR